MDWVIAQTPGEGNAVSAGMFSTNFLTRLFSADPNGTFARAVDLIGATGLRFPGGSMTEESFSVRDPNRAIDDDGRKLVPLDSFLDLARATCAEATIVIPTRGLLGTQVDSFGNRFVQPEEIAAVGEFVKGLLHQVGEQGLLAATGLIDAFEIGNEYWGSGQMTATEYGRVVAALAPEISRAIADTLGPGALPHIGILTQMGSPWSAEFDPEGLYGSLRSTANATLLRDLGLDASNFGSDGKLTWESKIALSNRDILDEITPEAEAALTGLVEHFYYDGRGDHLSHTSDAVRYIDTDLAFWRSAGFEDKALAITEWNVLAANDAQWGLKGAGVSLFQFESMVRMGATDAFSWPLLSSRTTDLAGALTGAPKLSPSGALLQHMSENLVGLSLLSVDDPGDTLLVSAFGDSERRVVYLCSRSAGGLDLRTDLNKLTGTMVLTSAKLLTVDAATGDGLHSNLSGSVIATPWYREHDAAASVVVLDTAAMYQNGTVTAHLDAYEIAMLIFEAPRTNSVSDAPTFLQLGSEGDETLAGIDGAWTLAGGDGNDIYMTDGDDRMVEGFGEGYDCIESSVSQVIGENMEGLYLTGTEPISGSGNALANWIVGNPAANGLSGGRGDDMLRGGAGHDTLTGGQGRDTLVGGQGGDSYLADGSDVIIEMPGEGIDTVETYVSFTLWSNVEHLFLRGADNLRGTGNKLDNLLLGNAAHNVLSGGRGSDSLDGGHGNDTLIGGQGRDFLYGGIGDDRYVIDETDTVVEYADEGFDTIESNISLTLGSSLEALLLAGSENISGTGNALDNLLIGNIGANLLRGGRGNDTLIGNAGSDTLVGGNGTDTFVFNTDPVASGFDVIEDFLHGVDQIELDQTTFGRLSVGILAADMFVVNETGLATAAHHRIIYQPSSGRLLYDADGSGREAALHFATLLNNLKLDAADFSVC